MKPILQIEDDQNDIFLLRHAMRKAGDEHVLHVLTDGQEAIDYLRGAGKYADRREFPLPCLVLLDLNLPCMSGLDVLRWIRQESGLPLVVLVLSTSADDDEVAAAYALGANGYLVKPSQASKLAEMAKSIKDFWLTHNTVPKEIHAALANSEPARSSGGARFPQALVPSPWSRVNSQTSSSQCHEKDHRINF